MLWVFLSGLALLAIFAGCVWWWFVLRPEKSRFVRLTTKDGRSVDVVTAPGLSERSALYNGLVRASAKLDETKPPPP
jgi:hypothetical protein